MKTLTGVVLATAALVAVAACGKKAGKEKSAAPPAPAKTTATAAPAPRTAVVTAGPLNLRDKAGRDGVILGRLSQGEKVVILEEGTVAETIDDKTAYWYKVETIDRKQGWVYGGYLDVGEIKATPAGATAAGAAPAAEDAPLAPINVAAASESGWNAAQYYQAGKKLADAKNYRDALPYLKAATELSPQTGAYWTDLGLALLELDRYGEGATAYERAVVLRPDDFWAHNNLGLACIKSNRPRRAVEVLERALKLEPKGAGDAKAAKDIARKNLAAAYEMNGQSEKAAALR